MTLNINFKWENSSLLSNTNTEKVELEFPNSPLFISVKIPPLVQDNATVELPFTCTLKTMPEKSTEKLSFQTTLEKIQALKIIAFSKTLGNKEVPFTPPLTLKNTSNYILTLLHTAEGLEAKLIPTEIDIDQDVRTIVIHIANTIFPLIRLHTPNQLFPNQKLIHRLLTEEIKHIPAPCLADLADQIRSTHAAFNQRQGQSLLLNKNLAITTDPKTLIQQQKYQKKFFKDFNQRVPEDKIKNFMSSYLVDMCPGHPSIASHVEKFYQDYKASSGPQQMVIKSLPI